MLSIPLIKPDLPRLGEVEAAFREVLENGKITNFGKYVTAFEKESGEYLGAETVTTSSGTMGLLLTLQALGLKPGQKVILPSFTFMATGQAVLYAGGIPLFAECEDDLTLSPSDLEQLLAKHDDVGAVIPVHTYGLPARTAEIESVVAAASRKQNRKISVMYDAAHGFGSSAGDRKVGTFGDAEVFSLSVTKMLVSVEGGMVSSRNPELIKMIRKMRGYGIEANYDAHWPGLNGKMSEFHAIIGLHNLRRLPALMAERQKKARLYLDRIQKETKFDTFPWPQGVQHTFKDFTVLMPRGLASRRDAVMESLKEQGIETRAYFHPPVHQQGFFKKYADRPLPRTEDLASRVITLPFYTSMTEAEINYVAEALVKSGAILEPQFA
jgi:dTDP-4-amino-4,6-dideoxygalactose transaminase